MRHLGKLILCFVGCVLLALFIVPGLLKPRYPRPEVVRTRQYIVEAYLAIHRWEKQNDANVEDLLRNEQDLNRTLTGKLIGEPWFVGFAVSTNGSAHLVDAWGRPLMICSKRSLPWDRASPALSQLTNDLVIWSAGADGTNDFGMNDDVVRFRR